MPPLNDVSIAQNDDQFRRRLPAARPRRGSRAPSAVPPVHENAAAAATALVNLSGGGGAQKKRKVTSSASSASSSSSSGRARVQPSFDDALAGENQELMDSNEKLRDENATLCVLLKQANEQWTKWKDLAESTSDEIDKMKSADKEKESAWKTMTKLYKDRSIELAKQLKSAMRALAKLQHECDVDKEIKVKLIALQGKLSQTKKDQKTTQDELKASRAQSKLLESAINKQNKAYSKAEIESLKLKIDAFNIESKHDETMRKEHAAAAAAMAMCKQQADHERHAMKKAEYVAHSNIGGIPGQHPPIGFAEQPKTWTSNHGNGFMNSSCIGVPIRQAFQSKMMMQQPMMSSMMVQGPPQYYPYQPSSMPPQPVYAMNDFATTPLQNGGWPAQMQQLHQAALAQHVHQGHQAAHAQPPEQQEPLPPQLPREQDGHAHYIIE